MANSADSGLKKPTDLDLHCLQNRVYPGSAGQGLIPTINLLNLSWRIKCLFLRNMEPLTLSDKLLNMLT